MLSTTSLKPDCIIHLWQSRMNQQFISVMKEVWIILYYLFIKGNFILMRNTQRVNFPYRKHVVNAKSQVYRKEVCIFVLIMRKIETMSHQNAFNQLEKLTTYTNFLWRTNVNPFSPFFKTKLIPSTAACPPYLPLLPPPLLFPFMSTFPLWLISPLSLSFNCPMKA